MQALFLSKALGARMSALGALTSSITNGGLDLVESSPVALTNGYPYTILSVSNTALSLIEDFDLNAQMLVVAVVGAAGSVGRGVATLLFPKGFSKLILIDVVKREKDIIGLKEDLQKLAIDTEISVSTKLESLTEAHVIITATNAPECVVASSHLSSGTIIVDDAQPSDIEPDVIENRKDVVVLEAGAIYAPEVTVSNNIELQGEHDIFCCLAEVIILARHGIFKNYSIGKLNDYSLVEHIRELSKGTNFRIAKYQNYHGVIHDEQINNVIKQLKKRYGHN